MKRRDFLSYSVLALGGLISSRLACGQQLHSLARGAVIVGVNKAGHLPPLSAAASGAAQVAKWLTDEDVDVKLLTDEVKPVRFSDIYDAIDEFVKRANLDQLIVYFSGHGFLNRYAECWLLSGAPENSNEAVNLVGTRFVAPLCGIPNVIFISDACRSIPNTFDASQINGGAVFPIPKVVTDVGKVDIFYATAPSNAAYELPVAESASQYHGIYTTCLLDAFRRPDDEMITSLSNGIRVVPNRKLERFLAREVSLLAQRRTIKLFQVPHCEVNSTDITYMGKVRAATAMLAPDVPTIKDVAQAAIEDSLKQVPAVFGPMTGASYRGDPNVEDLATSSGFRLSQDALLQTLPRASSFETQTGISISGAYAMASSASDSRVVRAPEILRRSQLIRVELRSGVPGCSVLVRFNNKFGAVIPVISEFISDVVVDDGGIVNISFIPSRNSNRWRGDADQLHRLRAAASTAVKFGVFQLDIIASLNITTSRDPTLDLYSAYAYAQASELSRLDILADSMEKDLGINLFDVSLLAGRLKSAASTANVVPFCPILAQGWSLLPVKTANLPATVLFARRYVRQAPWTTFERLGLDALDEGLRSGELQ